MAKRQRAIKKNYVESDDEDSTASRDIDWSPDEDETNQIQTESENDTSLPEDVEFDSTEGFQLKKVKSMKQSNHIIWTMFGHLTKNDKNIHRVKDRIFCIKCFDKKRFKR